MARRKSSDMQGTITSKLAKPKAKRTRKPMTEEQKAAAAERLAKARAAKGEVKNLSADESIRGIPDDDPLSIKNTKKNLKHNQDLLKAIKSLKSSKDASDRYYYNQISTYVDNLKKYLNTGVYLDNKFGAERTGTVKYKCVAMAYHKDGTPKRTVGVVYKDCGLWTQEMQDGEL
jgi:hypothetical protein